MVIAFEGLDGSGKTTISKHIYKRLLLYYKDTYWYPIDSKKKLSSTNFNDPIKSYNYFLENLKECTRDMSNKILIFDRYYLSAIGYRVLRNQERYSYLQAKIDTANINKYLPKPDLTFILKTSLSNRLINISKKCTIDNYDLDSLRTKNITHWENFYSYHNDNSVFVIIHNNNITQTLDIIWSLIINNSLYAFNNTSNTHII